MIAPKVVKPTKADEKDSYEIATLRDNNICQRCKRDCGPVARDHRKNRSQGGWTTASNLQCLGLGCHIWKGENWNAAVAEGWAVPGWPKADWRTWPARRWLPTGFGLRLAWVVYDDLGSWVEITEAEAHKRIGKEGA